MSDLETPIFDPEISPFEKLVKIMEILRSDQGCAWDRKQTHKSLIPYLIEEAYELVEAIDKDDSAAMCEELGDLLCQIVFHAQLASERGEFEIDDAVNSIADKLIRRHPHVFEQKKELDPKQVRDQWENIKINSGEKKSVLNGLPSSMPALLMAYRLGEKAGGVGFDWNTADEVMDKLEEEVDEIRQAATTGKRERLTDEIGDLLFATASLARKCEIDPERALKQALEKFRGRFEKLEQRVQESGKGFDSFTLDELEEIWQDIKR